MADPLDLRLDENPPERTPTGLYLVRLSQQLKAWGQRLLNNVPRRWMPRYVAGSIVFCQPWDFVRLASSVATVRLPDPATCPGASVVLVPETFFGASVVSTGGVHVDGGASLTLLPAWSWVEFVSHGAPTAAGSAARGGWRSRRSEHVSSRLVSGVPVTEISGTCATEDDANWVALLTLPVRGGSGCIFEAHVLNTSYLLGGETVNGIIVHGTYSSAGFWTAMFADINTYTWSYEHFNVTVSDPTVGNNIYIKVMGYNATPTTEHWIGYGRIIGELV